jgi:hypothetical protein
MSGPGNSLGAKFSKLPQISRVRIREVLVSFLARDAVLPKALLNTFAKSHLFSIHGTLSEWKEMAPKLIYYGTDHSHRVSVLRSAGYVVENCKSAPELVRFLESDAEILVIVFSDEERETPLEAVDAARARCSAPLIVFRDSATLHDAAGYDFTIPNLTPPAEWLKDIAALIEENRRSSSQGADSGKILAIDAAPSKIKRIERGPTSVDADLRGFGPPPEESSARPGNSADPRYLV